MSGLAMIPIALICGSIQVARKDDSGRIGRWNCHDCKSSFNVLAGTIFQKTKVPLQKWFLAIALILDAKKSISSHQLSRNLDLNQKTSWFMAMRIRKAMLFDKALLEGIVEADETYVGGRPRNRNNSSQRGRATGKTPIIGVVERGGKVVAKAAPKNKVNAKTITHFLTKHISSSSVLMTDKFTAYKKHWQKDTSCNHRPFEESM